MPNNSLIACDQLECVETRSWEINNIGFLLHNSGFYIPIIHKLKLTSELRNSQF